MTPTELTKSDFCDAADPFELFDLWFSDAKDSELNDPNAMSLATVDANGMPNVRIVLLKELKDGLFKFYTNLESTKGQELIASKKASLCFHWKSLRRQVRVRGEVSVVSNKDADEYYASRPRGSRIGAWASSQSRDLADRAELERSVNHFDQKFEGDDVPRPEHWSGFAVKPVSVEFWHDRPYRLHDRIVFERSEDNQWPKRRLYP